jgi:hypothetical protein
MVKSHLPIVSVDVPSGWNVEDGPSLGLEFSIQPQAVVSLTAPKLCMRGYEGMHYLGGLFVPRYDASGLFVVIVYNPIDPVCSSLALKYGLRLPIYPPAATFIRLFQHKL